MVKSATSQRQFDLFVPFVADLPLRDQRETMERPFFSLSKKKRLKPIEYISPDGTVYVNVYANANFGMATIWDADVLIWAASTLCEMKKRGINDIPRTLNFQPYDLLKTIHRDTGGREYKLLRHSLERLQSTVVKTNIRAEKTRRKERQFGWIESYTDLVDEVTNTSRGMSITLSDWFYEGVIMDGGVLAIDPVYFSINGGRERWLYRVARKHAGGAGEAGFAIALTTLFEKSGAEGSFRRFKFEILKIAREDSIPGFHLRLEKKAQVDIPVLRMIRRQYTPEETDEALARQTRQRHRKAEPPLVEPLPLFRPVRRELSEKAVAGVRRDFPGWDIYALKAEFDHWINEDNNRMPTNYEAAFYGFVKRHLQQTSE